jgi:hypothetical protein
VLKKLPQNGEKEMKCARRNGSEGVEGNWSMKVQGDL